MSLCDLHGPPPGLAACLDLLPLPVLLVDPGSGRVAHANPAARRAGLCAADGYAVEPDGGRIPAEQLARRLAARAGAADGLALTWHTEAGATAYLVHAAAIADRPGAAALLTFVDVTPLRDAEAQLRQAVRVREEFLSVATHELRDPLSSLRLSVDLLRHTVEKHGTVPAPALRHHLDISRRQTDRLARLVGELLDVSRLSAGRVPLDVEAFDLCDVTAEVVGQARAAAGPAGRLLTLEPSEPIIGYWDRGKVEQVLTNLLSNALKYGAGQPVTVRLCATATTAFWQVEDHGPGIAPADQRRIFERFVRAAETHKKESLGLGLAIARGLVEAHGGTITVRSAPSDGATFTIELPRKRMPQRDAPAADPAP